MKGKLRKLLSLWELSHYAKQHPTASTRNGIKNVNNLGCYQQRMRFAAVRNQQLEISTECPVCYEYLLPPIVM
jgi:hypothetical protein